MKCLVTDSATVRPSVGSRLMFFSALSADLLLVAVGGLMVWGSAAIPILSSKNNPLDRPITPFQMSLILSAPAFGALISLNLMAYISDLIGRRKSLLFLSISFVICLCGIAFAKNVYLYYLFFLINGFNFSGVCVNVATYNSEIVNDENRAWLGCILGLAFPVGNLIGFILGAYLTTITQYTLAAGFPVYIHILLQYFIVESPMYLVCKNKKTDALLALEKLRCYEKPIDSEIEYNHIEKLSLKSLNKNGKLFDIFSNPVASKAFIISLMLSFTQQSCGMYIVMNYAVPIFNEAGAMLSGNDISLLLGVLQVLIYVAVIFYINKLGRRPLLLFSSIGCAISTSVLAIYFYLKQYSPVTAASISVVPVISAMTFVISYSSGLGPITLSYLGELFSNEIRATAVATVLVLDAVVALSLNFTFPLLVDYFGIYMCMSIYSLSALTGFVLMAKFLPETRGKSLIKIQESLKEW
ncbi:glucose transporter GlcP-like [Diabrotica virgifera virgifera]|uniref:Facilitated trehalose transporter Tret1-like n=1 Tax=Diabrotica virgifera virgifera TaxID=50390 RepID=A0A6P7FWQ7_DIAVI|nr:glucose transporter GlcP-like [Diabrotica virgifera virgifera]